MLVDLSFGGAVIQPTPEDWREIRGLHFEQLHKQPVLRVCTGNAQAGEPHIYAAWALQVDGRKYPSLEDGVQVVVIDGRQGHVVSQGIFRSSLLQGIPWQIFSYVAAIPDK